MAFDFDWEGKYLMVVYCSPELILLQFLNIYQLLLQNKTLKRLKQTII